MKITYICTFVYNPIKEQYYIVHVLYHKHSFCESNIRILTFRVKLYIFLFCANCTCKNEIYLLCFSRLLMTFTEKRSKEASKIEKKKIVMSLFLILIRLTTWESGYIHVGCFSPTCNKMHLSKLWKVYVHVLLLTELILAVSQIRMQNLLQQDYYKIIISDYLAKVDQSDHRKITIHPTKVGCGPKLH